MTVYNIIQVTHIAATNKTTSRFNTLMKASINNESPDLSVVDQNLGFKAGSSADLGRTVLRNMATGFNIINTALASSREMRNQLEKIKQEIASLSSASDTDLVIAEDNYTGRVGQIFNTLNKGNFLRRNLFDGTLAKAPATRLPAQSLPLYANPFRVQISNNMADTIDITISRLLPGDGTIVNTPVNGTFNTIFPVTDNTVMALSNLNNVANIGAAGPGFFDSQRLLIANSLPAGINAEQDIIRNIVLDAYDNNARQTIVAGGGADNAANANIALEFAKAIGKFVTLSANNANDIRAARNQIDNIFQNRLADPTAFVDNNDAITFLDNTIPEGAEQSYALNVFKDMIIAATRIEIVVHPGVNDDASARTALGFARGFLNLPAIDEALNRPLQNPIYIGSIKTPASRFGAMRIMNNAIDVLDKVIASLSGKENNLKSADSSLTVQNIEEDAASHNYLDANPRQIASEATQLIRSEKVSNLIFMLSEIKTNIMYAHIQKVIDSVSA